MDKTLLSELRRIQQLSVGELQHEWSRLYDGELCRSRNRQYLVRRLCWRLQERELGGLSVTALAKIQELAPREFSRSRTPNVRGDVAVQMPKVARIRDPKRPTSGTVLTRQYRGQEIRVTALDDGFEWNARQFNSLSAVAQAVTGAKWNGRLFFQLTERKRKA